MEIEKGSALVYSPAAVLNLFNNSLNVAQSKKLIQLRGVFQPGKGGNYGRVFCRRDRLCKAIFRGTL